MVIVSFLVSISLPDIIIFITIIQLIWKLCGRYNGALYYNAMIWMDSSAPQNIILSDFIYTVLVPVLCWRLMYTYVLYWKEEYFTYAGF